MNAEEKGTEGSSCEMSEGDAIKGVRCPALQGNSRREADCAPSAPPLESHPSFVSYPSVMVTVFSHVGCN